MRLPIILSILLCCLTLNCSSVKNKANDKDEAQNLTSKNKKDPFDDIDDDFSDDFENESSDNSVDDLADISFEEEEEEELTFDEFNEESKDSFDDLSFDEELDKKPMPKKIKANPKKTFAKNNKFGGKQLREKRSKNPPAPFLFKAAAVAPLGTIKLLIDKGAKVNIQNRKGNSPFLIAAKYHRPEVLKFLKANGAKINIKNKNMENALSLALTAKKKGQNQRRKDMTVKLLTSWGLVAKTKNNFKNKKNQPAITQNKNIAEPNKNIGKNSILENIPSYAQEYQNFSKSEFENFLIETSFNKSLEPPSQDFGHLVLSLGLNPKTSSNAEEDDLQLVLKGQSIPLYNLIGEAHLIELKVDSVLDDRGKDILDIKYAKELSGKKLKWEGSKKGHKNKNLSFLAPILLTNKVQNLKQIKEVNGVLTVKYPLSVVNYDWQDFKENMEKEVSGVNLKLTKMGQLKWLFETKAKVDNLLDIKGWTAKGVPFDPKLSINSEKSMEIEVSNNRPKLLRFYAAQKWHIKTYPFKLK